MKKQNKKITSPGKGQLKKNRQNGVPAKKNSYPDILGLGIIILLGIIIYSNSFSGSFHFDDLNNIVDNTHLRKLDVIDLWNFSQARLVAYYSFAINYHFDKLNVWGYHLVNLAIHLVNACIVWWLTILIFSSPVLKDNPLTRHKRAIAFFTAILFVSHPLATQSVTYIVQRMASLVTLFYLLSVALYIKGRLTEKSDLSRYLLFGGSLIAAVLAMMTKQNAFTLPFAILLVEILFLQTKKPQLNIKGNRILLFIAAAALILLIVFFKFSLSIFEPLPPTQGNTFTITSSNYLMTQFSVIVKYIQLLFLPLNQNADYDFPIAETFFGTRTMLSFLFLVGLLGFAAYSFKRNRIISFGIFWFFLTLSIESSFKPINDVIFEHRTYLPSFGFFLVLSTGVYYLFRNKQKSIAMVLLVLLTVVYSVIAYQRNKVWKDELTLWSDVISKSPKKARPYFNRGLAYHNTDQLEEAIADYTMAIRFNPEYTNAYSNRGLAYYKLKQLDKAIADNSRAIEIDPDFKGAYNTLGLAYNDLGKLNEAIANYTKAIEIDPNYKDAYSNRGISYGNLGQWENSIADFTKAIEIDPDFKAAYSNLEIARRKLDEARK